MRTDFGREKYYLKFYVYLGKDRQAFRNVDLFFRALTKRKNFQTMCRIWNN